MALKIRLKHGKIEAQQNVNRNLGRAGCEEYRYDVGCIGVGVWQPDMQGENSGLQREADGDETGSDQDRFLVGDVVNSELHVGQVKRTGHQVDQADADQVESGADRAHDQIREYGSQCTPVGSACNQHVARQG